MGPKLGETAKNEQQCDPVSGGVFWGTVPRTWTMQFNADKMYKVETLGGNKPNIESTDYMEQSCSVLTRKGI